MSPNASPMATYVARRVKMAVPQPKNTRTNVPSTSAAIFWTVVEESAMAAA